MFFRRIQNIGAPMKTVFCLFKDVHSAENATEEILDPELPESQINVLIQEVVAKENLNITDHKTMVHKTNHPGENVIHGLSSFLIGLKGINTSDAGRILAAGTIATEIAGTASVKTSGGLELVLKDFGIPDIYASEYIAGLVAGGVLLIVKTENSNAGVIVQIAENNKTKGVYSIPRDTPAL